MHYWCHLSANPRASETRNRGSPPSYAFRRLYQLRSLLSTEVQGGISSGICDVNYFVMWQSGYVVYVFRWFNILCQSSSGRCYRGRRPHLEGPVICIRTCSEGSVYCGHGKKSHGSWARQSSVVLFPCLQFTLIQASTSPKCFPLVKAITGLSSQTFIWREWPDSWRWLWRS